MKGLQGPRVDSAMILLTLLAKAEVEQEIDTETVKIAGEYAKREYPGLFEDLVTYFRAHEERVGVKEAIDNVGLAYLHRPVLFGKDGEPNPCGEISLSDHINDGDISVLYPDPPPGFPVHTPRKETHTLQHPSVTEDGQLNTQTAIETLLGKSMISAKRYLELGNSPGDHVTHTIEVEYEFDVECSPPELRLDLPPTPSDHCRVFLSFDHIDTDASRCVIHYMDVPLSDMILTKPQD